MALDILDQTIPLDNDQPPIQPTPHEWVGLDQAAAHLGISVKTLRRRIQKGQIAARRVEIPGGFTYRVQIPAHAAQGWVGSPPDNPGIPSDQRASHDGQGPDQPLLDTLREVIDQLQDETRRLHRENLELAGRCGWLQGQLQAAHERIALLEAPPVPESSESAPSAQPNGAAATTGNEPDGQGNGQDRPPERRHWWQFWNRGR